MRGLHQFIYLNVNLNSCCVTTKQNINVQLDVRQITLGYVIRPTTIYLNSESGTL